MRAAILTVVLGLALAAPATAATQSQVYRDSKDICALFRPASVAKTYNAKSPTAKAAAHGSRTTPTKGRSATRPTAGASLGSGRAVE
jgi:hypothetical protein